MTVRALIAFARAAHMRVAVTAMTGSAAADMNGCTLHKVLCIPFMRGDDEKQAEARIKERFDCILANRATLKQLATFDVC